MAMAICVSEILAFLTTSDSVHSDGSLTIRTEEVFWLRINFFIKYQNLSRFKDFITVVRAKILMDNYTQSELLKSILKNEFYQTSRTIFFMPTKGNHDVKEVNYFQWVNFTIKTANKSIINALS